MSEKRYILKKTNTISTNYPTSAQVYDTVLKRELYDSEIVDLLNNLVEERDYWKKKYEAEFCWASKKLKVEDKRLKWKVIK